jgi:hypothetical protein
MRFVYVSFNLAILVIGMIGTAVALWHGGRILARLARRV